MTENMLEEPRLFNSKLELALNQFKVVNRFHLENSAKLRKSSNLAERMIGICAPVAQLAMAYTFAPLIMLVAMEDAEYSSERGGYTSSSYEAWLDEANRRSGEEK